MQKTDKRKYELSDEERHLVGEVSEHENKKESKIGKVAKGLLMGLGGFAAIFACLAATQATHNILGFGVVIWALWWAYELGQEVASKKK